MDIVVTYHNVAVYEIEVLREKKRYLSSPNENFLSNMDISNDSLNFFSKLPPR